MRRRLAVLGRDSPQRRKVPAVQPFFVPVHQTAVGLNLNVVLAAPVDELGPIFVHQGVHLNLVDDGKGPATFPKDF